MKTERYLKYSPTRDVVFVLGAGASYGDGVPLQRDILPMLLDGSMENLEQSATIRNNPVIIRLFSEASREIRAARRIVFIGYSLSDGDVHVKALFKKHLQPDVELVAINPTSSESVRHRYSALSRNTRFCQRTFEDLVQNEGLMKELLIG